MNHRGRAGSAIAATALSKSFGGVTAVDSVSLEVREAEIHAVVGENGAGKTTLMRMLDGLIEPDHGEIVIRGQLMRHGDPQQARRLGVGMVHQHFALVPTMTVTENMLLGGARAILDRGAARRRLIEVAAENGLEIDPDARVGSLPIGLQQRVEILKMLYYDAEILILDEPTSVLTPHEIEELLVTLRRLRDQGKAILFISHKLPEVLAIADTITVMRRGAVVAVLEGAATNQEDLAHHMVGELDVLIHEARTEPADELFLELEEVSAAASGAGSGLHDVSLAVRSGEILAIAGVAGNGQAELARAIAGHLPATTGRISLAGVDVTRTSARRRRELGLAFAPQDRLHEGIAPDATVEQNLILGLHRRNDLQSGGLFRRTAVRRFAQDLVDRYDIRTPSLDVATSALSGGNIQKLIIARELAGYPRVVIVEEPTWGLDLKASGFIRQELLSLRNAGLAILLVSSDLDEVLQLADRIAVLYGGRIAGEVTPGRSASERIGSLMTGAS